MAVARAKSNVVPLRRKRRPLTNQQRNILQAERSGIRAVRAKSAARQEAAEAQYAARTESEVAIARARESERTKGYYKRHTGTKVIGAVATASKPVANPILLIILTIAGLIIFYLFVTSAEAFTGFTKSLQTGLSKLSTTSPLFVRGNNE